MRLALRFLGVELFSVELTGDEIEYVADEPGDCVSFPIGFTASFEMPDEVGLPNRDY